MKRWGGLYKSTVPALLFWFSTSFIWHILPSIPLWKISRTLISFLPPAFLSLLSPILSTDALEDAVASLLFLPAKLTFLVLTCRAITTDAALPFYSRPFRDAFKNALNALFTPSELAQPLKALTSQRMRGVILCEVLRGLYIFLVYQPLYTLHGALDPGLHPDSNPSQRALIVRGIIYTASFFTLLGVSSAILCPLDVVKARLSALYPDEVDDIVTRAGKEGVLIMLKDDKEEDGEEGKALLEREEDEPLVDAASLESITKEITKPIPSTPKAFRYALTHLIPTFIRLTCLPISLRPEPYTSVWHCLRTTLAEEGARPLWRAWWATWIGLNFDFSG